MPTAISNLGLAAVVVLAGAFVWIASGANLIRMPPGGVREIEISPDSIRASIPGDWEADFSRSGCRPPCITLLRPKGPNGGQALSPSITFQAARIGRGFVSPREYVEPLLERGVTLLVPPRTEFMGDKRGFSYTVSSRVIVDTIESFTQGVSSGYTQQSRYLIFPVHGYLYECVIAGRESDLENFADDYEYFCGSVAESSPSR